MHAIDVRATIIGRDDVVISIGRDNHAATGKALDQAGDEAAISERQGQIIIIIAALAPERLSLLAITLDGTKASVPVLLLIKRRVKSSAACGLTL
jgi:hypothetical protein